MGSNDVVLLQDMLGRSRAETREVLSENDHHTYYAAKYYLGDLQPSHEDLMSGLVDGTLDGGIDAIYIYANGYCVRDDLPLAGLGRSPEIDLVLMQVKNTAGFGESAIDKLIVNLPRLLDLERDEQELAKTFNSRVIELTRRFLNIYRTATLPELRIFACFASLKADGVHDNVRTRGDALTAALRSCFRNSSPSVDFLDAAEVFDLARRPAVSTRTLVLAENPISTDQVGGLVGLVRISEFERFITDSAGRLESTLFDANVRDYEGDTVVNRKIRETLKSSDSGVDFWWLNNGVTIIASRVSATAKHLQLESPQIVNGLQTSHEIYGRSRRPRQQREERSLLVKIIEVSHEGIRDKIIEATNSQTALTPSALRATDRVQRQIEEFLRKHEYYYERRRNLYANQGIGFDRLVSIDDMGRALLGTIAQMPHIARGEVSRIYEDQIYDALFSPKNDIGCYLGAIEVVRSVESFLRRTPATRGNVDDLEFHLSMMLAVALTRKERPKAADLAKIDITQAEALLPNLLRIVQEEFASVARRQGETLFERLAKSAEVTDALTLRTRRYLASSSRTGA